MTDNMSALNTDTENDYYFLYCIKHCQILQLSARGGSPEQLKC